MSFFLQHVSRPMELLMILLNWRPLTRACPCLRRSRPWSSLKSDKICCLRTSEDGPGNSRPAEPYFKARNVFVELIFRHFRKNDVKWIEGPTLKIKNLKNFLKVDSTAKVTALNVMMNRKCFIWVLHSQNLEFSKF